MTRRKKANVDLVIILWSLGYNTADIGRHLEMGESHVAKVLWKWREDEYRARPNNQNNDSLPAVSQPNLEDQREGNDVLKPGL